MKWVIIFFIYFLSSLQIFSAQSKETIKNGSFKEYYKTGELKIEGQYQNNKRVGEWRSYHKNGNLSTEYSYKKGKRNKEFRSYFKDGSLSNITEKVDDVYIEKGYYESGRLKYERQVESGFYKSYFESGELEIEANYLEYDLVGKWKYYYKNGNLEWIVNYKEGYRDGVYKHFYKNGNIKLEGNLARDKKDGEEKRYLLGDKLEWKGKYSKDKLVKTWVKFDSKGKKNLKVKFKNGKVIKPDQADIIKPTKVKEGIIERVPIYPSCEELLTNKKRKKCMSTAVMKHVIAKFNTDIAANLNLPSGKKRIFVSFKIDKNGNVKEVTSRGPHPNLEKEAIRVINLLPKITPGYQRGKAVIVPYSLPIIFQVQ